MNSLPQVLFPSTSWVWGFRDRQTDSTTNLYCICRERERFHIPKRAKSGYLQNGQKWLRNLATLIFMSLSSRTCHSTAVCCTTDPNRQDGLLRCHPQHPAPAVRPEARKESKGGGGRDQGPERRGQ